VTAGDKGVREALVDPALRPKQSRRRVVNDTDQRVARRSPEEVDLASAGNAS
jgi:hypothetical protein